MKQKLRLFLTGGLGNQLFQLAAALHYQNGRSIVLDLETAKPRRNSSGRAEVTSLNLPRKIELVEKQREKIVTKVFGYNLRSGYLPRKYENLKIFCHVRNFASAIILSFLLKEKLKVAVSKNLGFDDNLFIKERNELIIGYFQTYKVAHTLLEYRDSLFDGLDNIEVLNYKALAESEQPLLVHVRLGDYLMEDNFGILGSSYYESATRIQWQTGVFKKIWLFSDQPADAIRQIPSDLRKFTRVIPGSHMESAETLKVMTFCKGFVIANSSFSWWAAYLREDQGSLVIAPQPWFLKLPEPNELIPLSWRRLPGF